MSIQKQYLTLRVGEATYGIGIHKVREVVTYETPSPMPNSSGCMTGVIRLRGNAVPVLDLRLKFGLPEIKATVDTCIIILELEVKQTKSLIGITADMVQQVAEFGKEDLEEPPCQTDGESAGWIQAMARFEDGFVILLDIDKTLEQDTLTTVHEEIYDPNGGLENNITELQL